MAYKDSVPIILDEIEEHSLEVAKEYNIPYNYIMDNMCYTDIGVLYAKIANNKAFSNYNDFLKMDDKAKGSHVMEYGEVKPYVFQTITPEQQQKAVEEMTEAQKKLRETYRSGGKFND